MTTYHFGKPRWKTLVELLGGATMVVAGGLLADQGVDLAPFNVHDWWPLVIGVIVMVQGWDHVQRAWADI